VSKFSLPLAWASGRRPSPKNKEPTPMSISRHIAAAVIAVLATGFSSAACGESSPPAASANLSKYLEVVDSSAGATPEPSETEEASPTPTPTESESVEEDPEEDDEASPTPTPSESESEEDLEEGDEDQDLPEQASEEAEEKAKEAKEDKVPKGSEDKPGGGQGD